MPRAHRRSTLAARALTRLVELPTGPAMRAVRLVTPRHDAALAFRVGIATHLDSPLRPTDRGRNSKPLVPTQKENRWVRMRPLKVVPFV